MRVPAYLADKLPQDPEVLLTLVIDYYLGAPLSTLAEEYSVSETHLNQFFCTEKRRKSARDSNARRYKANPAPFAARSTAWAALVRGAEGKGLTAEDWRMIKRAWSGRCAYCQRPGRLTMDHIHPLSKGGRHEPANIAPACISCNTSKNNRLDWNPAKVALVAKKACDLADGVVY